MSESHEALRERVIDTALASFEASRKVQEAYLALQNAVDALPQKQALDDAVAARKTAGEATNDAVAAIEAVFPITEQIEIGNIIATRAGAAPLPLEEAVTLLTPQERERYNQELKAMDEALSVAEGT